MLLIIVILSILIPFFIHIFLVRLCGLFKKPFSRQKGVIASFVLGFIPLGIVFLLWIINLNIDAWSPILWSGIYLFLVYILFSYVYFHVFNMSETARRIRILTEIYRTGALKKGELAAKYTRQDMISNRLKRLVALEGLRLSKNRYILGNRLFFLLAKAIFNFRCILFPPQ